MKTFNNDKNQTLTSAFGGLGKRSLDFFECRPNVTKTCSIKISWVLLPVSNAGVANISIWSALTFSSVLEQFHGH